MSSPQLENGFTRIANEILEALSRVNLSPYESRVLWFILRQTYGFNKKMDQIPLRQFSKALALDRRLVHRALKGLESKMVVVIGRDDRDGLAYGFQKDYSRWKVSSKKMTVISKDDKASSPQMTIVSSVEIPSKEIKKKERERVRGKPSPDSLSSTIEKTIQRLNELSGKFYRPDSKNVNHYLAARLKDGFTEADCLLVVEDRWQRWKDKADMAEHFNPVTLFRPSNFERYLTEAKAANGAGREPTVKGLGNGWVEVDGRRMDEKTYRLRYGKDPKPNA